MTILTLNRKELEAEIGKITPKIEEKLNMFGMPIENLTDEEFSIDITANRPDLLSLHGYSRAILSFLDKKTGLKEYKVKKPEKNYSVTIDKSVKKVRPFTVCAIVKNLKFNDEKIKEIIDIQEKLHGGYGRNRKKLAIGVYPLEQIKLPIRYLAKKPEDIKFQPLEFPREINGRQILSQHPTGREYGNLLKDAEVFPIFLDANDEILSMPPIINSHKTGKINSDTKEVFIECSGFNLEYLKKTLNMIVCALADMGGKIYAMEINDAGKKELSPNLEPEKMNFSIENVNKLIGINLNEKEIIKYLEKMGLGYLKEKNQSFALVPCYRTDILHEVDIAEDIAIAYGYENLVPELPEISTIGEEDSMSVKKGKIAEILIGLGLLEVSSYHVSTKEKQFKDIGIKEFKEDMIEVIDSKTENNILRNSLLANSIAILSENSDAAYPQRLFELGRVFSNQKNDEPLHLKRYSLNGARFLDARESPHSKECGFQDSRHNEKTETGIQEKENLCISLCHEKANFTEIKQVLDYLTKMLNLKYEIKESSHPSFIEGRCGEVIVNNKSIGFIGEIHPGILKNNKIMMPVASLEVDTEKLID